MPTGHGDGVAIFRLEDRSRRLRPCSFRRRSGLRVRRQASPVPSLVNARAQSTTPLRSILSLSRRFGLLSSSFYPHVGNASPRRKALSSASSTPISRIWIHPDHLSRARAPSALTAASSLDLQMAVRTPRACIDRCVSLTDERE